MHNLEKLFIYISHLADYSLEGPAELNLTEREIRQLTLPAPEQSNATGI